MKRRRINPHDKANFEQRTSAKSSASTQTNQKRRRIRLDDLQWKGVSLPDRLEDFEGFYGLEEIADVEVIKDVTGQILFETKKSEADIAREKEEAASREEEDEHHKKLAEAEYNESWSGFSDDSVIQDSEMENEDQDQVDHGKASANIFERNGTETPKAKEEEYWNSIEDIDKNGAARKRTPQVNGATHKASQKEAKVSHLEVTSTGTQGIGGFHLLADRNGEDDEEEEVDVSAWHRLGLSTRTLRSLSRLKFQQPTAIQSSTVPEIMAGCDIIGKASTGSGKTLAFGIPILEAFLADHPKSLPQVPLALIISPTRELAHQIAAHLAALCENADDDQSPMIATITGGLSIQKQRRLLEKADIIVGTPGRLWEVISSGQGFLVSIKKIRFLVIDEADRLLSQGHFKELGQILDTLSRDEQVEEATAVGTSSRMEPQHQTLVFSATFQKGLQQKLVGKGPKGADVMSNQESMEYLLKKLRFKDDIPKFIDANPSSQMASKLKEGLVECAGTEKDLFTYALLMYHPKKRALVFTNSIAAVRRLTPFLSNLNLSALPLHSGMEQKARLRSIERFKTRPGSILVATDVAARGLDIPQVELILHYHLPRAADTYVHRSGRTARAEASGLSILICAPEEVAGVRRLIAKVHARAEQSHRSKSKAHFIRTLDIDRRIVSRLKPRATLSKKLADSVIAKEKKHSEEDWMRAAAEELGVDYDSETFEKEAKGRKGRGSGRQKKEKEAREMSKNEVQALRAELRAMLNERINVGVSARYLTSGGIDVDALMKGEGSAEFLGDVGELGLED